LLKIIEQTCALRHCDPCTRGQDDIRQSIRTIEDLERQNPHLGTQSEIEKVIAMIQKISITTRADLLEHRKQQYLEAGYRIENEHALPNGMSSFTAIRTVKDEPTSGFE
jgi:NADH:ubiquinone oxidoreductase subunit F (NADH-binding)